jgi:hypothetical protein
LTRPEKPVTCCHIGEEVMAGHGKKNKDEQLLLTLACGATVEATARAVGLSGRVKARAGMFRGPLRPGWQRENRKLSAPPVFEATGEHAMNVRMRL